MCSENLYCQVGKVIVQIRINQLADGQQNMIWHQAKNGKKHERTMANKQINK